jgi:hypothetical protein
MHEIFYIETIHTFLEDRRVNFRNAPANARQKYMETYGFIREVETLVARSQRKATVDISKWDF